jgi:hypothetical protein
VLIVTRLELAGTADVMLGLARVGGVGPKVGNDSRSLGMLVVVVLEPASTAEVTLDCMLWVGAIEGNDSKSEGVEIELNSASEVALETILAVKLGHLEGNDCVFESVLVCVWLPSVSVVLPMLDIGYDGHVGNGTICDEVLALVGIPELEGNEVRLTVVVGLTGGNDSMPVSVVIGFEECAKDVERVTVMKVG